MSEMITDFFFYFAIPFRHCTVTELLGCSWLWRKWGHWCEHCWGMLLGKWHFVYGPKPWGLCAVHWWVVSVTNKVSFRNIVKGRKKLNVSHFRRVTYWILDSLRPLLVQFHAVYERPQYLFWYTPGWEKYETHNWILTIERRLAT